MPWYGDTLVDRCEFDELEAYGRSGVRDQKKATFAADAPTNAEMAAFSAAARDHREELEAVDYFISTFPEFLEELSKWEQL